MMKLVVLLILPVTVAFQAPIVLRVAPTKTVWKASSHDLSFNPMEGYKGVDMERARECAQHFGECSVEEMEDLRSNLHKERLQNFMFGGSAMTKPGEDAMEHLLLEEELDMQLALLQTEEHALKINSDLFPDIEEPMEELPHLKDNTLAAKTADMVHRAEQALAYEETVLEESVLETAVICMVIASILFLPQFF